MLEDTLTMLDDFNRPELLSLWDALHNRGGTVRPGASCYKKALNKGLITKQGTPWNPATLKEACDQKVEELRREIREKSLQ